MSPGCQCAAGCKPGGADCVVDKCFDWPNQRPKTCSGHGSCDAYSGECHCAPGYIGVDCAENDVSPYFPNTRLITTAGGDNLKSWMPYKAKGKQWSLCFSSFTDNATTPSTFHTQCDQHDTTLTVARNSLNYTFGGYVRLPPCFVLFLLCAFLSSFVQRSGQDRQKKLGGAEASRAADSTYATAGPLS
eukprot:COSAG06_NODE_855_length_11931_cov_20.218813_11_plen_188_part_00